MLAFLYKGLDLPPTRRLLLHSRTHRPDEEGLCHSEGPLPLPPGGGAPSRPGVARESVVPVTGGEKHPPMHSDQGQPPDVAVGLEPGNSSLP